MYILHLEDNLLDAELVEANLLEGGFEFTIKRVDTRPEFVSAVTDECFDLILADYSLPSFDGFAALEIAKVSCPNTPFIIISGALGEELAIETLKSGATDYILKHRLERLVPSVERAMRETAERAARIAAERDLQLLLEREQEARLKAEEANRLKDEFLATVSHELRTPLNAIYGWASILRAGGLNEKEQENAVEIIARNAKAQIQLIEDLLDVSRIITGKLRLDIRAVEPREILESAVETVRPAADAKAIELSAELDKNARLIFADANRLQQIIWNLISNAVKFTPRGGRVMIRLSLDDDNVNIAVQDTGQGIAPAFLPYVFDRFRQAEQTTTRLHGGLGLGLAIVKHLVEMHGGSVRAESPGSGRGATFTAVFPQLNSALPLDFKQERILTNNEKAVVEIVNGDLPLADLRILAVDDDNDSRELLEVLLAQNGATVTVAADALEALTMLERGSYDVLISDVGMPEIDGYDLISRIRVLPNEKNKKIPAVALTGFARDEDYRRALSAGFNAHVAKPIEPQTLVQTILKIKN